MTPYRVKGSDKLYFFADEKNVPSQYRKLNTIYHVQRVSPELGHDYQVNGLAFKFTSSAGLAEFRKKGLMTARTTVQDAVTNYECLLFLGLTDRYEVVTDSANEEV